MIPSAEVDHLVIAAETLAQGCDYVESGLGVRPAPGGKHVTMGTHNALVGLGPHAYIEIIAIDPEAARRRVRAGSTSTTCGCAQRSPKDRG